MRLRAAPRPPDNLLNTRAALPPPTRPAKHKLGFLSVLEHEDVTNQDRISGGRWPRLSQRRPL